MSQQSISLISSGAVCKRLGITRSTLQHMFKHIPHVYIRKTGAHLFPLSYINAFVAHLESTGQRAKADSAADFWGTREAYRVYRIVALLIEEGLDRTALTGGELSELLGIPYNTLVNWGNNDVLERERTRLRPNAREIVVFSCEGVKRALKWQVPLAPPALPPLFIVAAEVNRRIQQHGRVSKEATGMFGQLQTPAGGSIFPLLYVAALLENTSGPVTRKLAATFNTTDVAKEAMTKAKAEFERRLGERQQASPYPDGLLSVATVAWLLNVSTTIIRRWCDGGLLPYVTGSGTKLIPPSALSARIRWVFPTGK